MATFLTSVTTALGFLTLLTSSIGPIHDLGCTQPWVWASHVLAFTLLPAVMVLAPPPAVSPRHRVFWNHTLLRMLRWTLRHKLALAGLWCWWLAPPALSTQLRVDNKLIGLARGRPLPARVRVLRAGICGCAAVELSVTMPEDVQQAAMLTALDALEGICAKTTAWAPSWGLPPPSNGPPWIHGRPRRPIQGAAIRRHAQAHPEVERSGQWSAMVAQDGKRVRILGKVEDVGSRAWPFETTRSMLGARRTCRKAPNGTSPARPTWWT